MRTLCTFFATLIPSSRAPLKCTGSPRELVYTELYKAKILTPFQPFCPKSTPQELKCNVWLSFAFGDFFHFFFFF